MSHTLHINSTASREEKYKEIIPQLKALLEGETDTIANMANLSAALRQTFNFFWIGFYIVKNEELVLGPFQGTIACTRIKFGKGVCGTAWKTHQTILVPDVDLFPGHIACDNSSRSEIVIPVFKNAKIIAVLDIDSDLPNNFDQIDQTYLEEIIKILENTIT